MKNNVLFEAPALYKKEDYQGVQEASSVPRLTSHSLYNTISLHMMSSETVHAKLSSERSSEDSPASSDNNYNTGLTRMQAYKA